MTICRSRLQTGDISDIETKNQIQRETRQRFDPFFANLHDALKAVDRVVRQHEKQIAEAARAEGKRANVDRNLRRLKTALEELHREAGEAESFYRHITWLQERFPSARYEDVTGLCKLATTAEIREQDFSLNPGRYVGVVIEEDGKTEAEFTAEILSLNDELETLNQAASELEKVIGEISKQLRVNDEQLDGKKIGRLNPNQTWICFRGRILC